MFVWDCDDGFDAIEYATFAFVVIVASALIGFCWLTGVPHASEIGLSLPRWVDFITVGPLWAMMTVSQSRWNFIPADCYKSQEREDSFTAIWVATGLAGTVLGIVPGVVLLLLNFIYFRGSAWIIRHLL